MYRPVIHFYGLVMLIFSGLACGGDEPAAQASLRPVRYQQVFASGGVRLRTFAGAARAGQESNLSFRVPGTVLAIPIKVGDRVATGDIIAYLDPKDYQLQAQQAEATLTQVKAQARNAESDYERVRALYENNNASKDNLDGARAGFESVTAQLAATENQLELVRLQLSYTRLTAPAGGRIASQHVEINENVQPGQTIVMLTEGSQIEVEVAIPEVLITNIHSGSPVSVAFDAIPDRKYDAIVREVGVSSTEFATTFPVTVRVTNSDDLIRSGMAAEVTFQFTSGDNRERYVVPPVAVGEDREGRFVFVIEPVVADTAIVRRRNVQIGELTSNGLEVISGLSDRELVVTAGVSKVQDGDKVKF